MQNDKKTHYRKVFKSDHLGVADLEDFLEEGRRLVFTIKQVKQEFNTSVAGRKGDFNIAYFVENIKPMVLNATNSSRVSSFAKNSPWVEDWSNILVELYIDRNVKLMKDIVGGVRIKTRQPTLTPKAKPPIAKERFEKAIDLISKGEYPKEKLIAAHSFTKEQKTQLDGIVIN